MDPILKGSASTIGWGSSGLQGGLSATVVESIKATDVNGSPVEIENNDGFTIGMVLLENGFDATVEALYDSRISWPAKGDDVSLKLRRLPAPLTCVLVSIEDSQTRKKETMLTMKLAYRPMLGQG